MLNKTSSIFSFIKDHMDLCFLNVLFRWLLKVKKKTLGWQSFLNTNFRIIPIWEDIDINPLFKGKSYNISG